MDMLPRLTRRQTMRLLGGTALAAVPLLGAAGEASAGRVWCRADPTFQIAGHIVHLYVSGELDRRYDVSGPTTVIVRVPLGLSTATLESDNGFGHGYAISFVAEPKLKVGAKDFEISVDVYVPSTMRGKGLPIRVEWVVDRSVEISASSEKHTNEWIKLATKIRRQS